MFMFLLSLLSHIDKFCFVEKIISIELICLKLCICKQTNFTSISDITTQNSLEIQVYAILKFFFFIFCLYSKYEYNRHTHTKQMDNTKSSTGPDYTYLYNITKLKIDSPGLLNKHVLLYIITSFLLLLIYLRTYPTAVTNTKFF